MLKLSDFKKFAIESEIRKICGGVAKTGEGTKCEDFKDKCDVTTLCDGTEKSDQVIA